MSAPQKYRKCPVVIEAMRCMEPNRPEDVARWCGGEIVGDGITFNPFSIDISTLEGVMRANYGDYVIRGVKGEHYPCRADIFAATYEAVTE